MVSRRLPVNGARPCQPGSREIHESATFFDDDDGHGGRTNINPQQICTLSNTYPTVRAQPIVEPGQTITFSMPYFLAAACDGDYEVYAAVELKGGAITAATATDTLTFVPMP